MSEEKKIIILEKDSEADTCRKYILPKLYGSKWNDDQIMEQRTFTDGQIIVVGRIAKRKKPKKADYLLRYEKNSLVAVIEAKKSYKKAGDGLQQAKIQHCFAKTPEYWLLTPGFLTVQYHNTL